jgi:hypothetical protein
VFGLALFGAAGSAHALVIDTSGSDVGGITPFGEPDTATYGQTFTADNVDVVLDGFSFWFDDYLNPDTVDFRAYVMAWDGNSGTGPILFQSGDQTSTNNGGAGGQEQFDFVTGGIALTGGQQYVAFLSVSELFDGSQGTSIWKNAGNAYAGGGFVFLNNGNDSSQWTSADWGTLGTSDTWFRAEFAPIPEPSALVLFPIGLAVLGVAMRRCKQVA